MTLNVVIEQGKLNDYLMRTFFSAIKNNTEFDKIVNECLLKHGFKVLKTGAGNFLIN